VHTQIELLTLEARCVKAFCAHEDIFCSICLRVFCIDTCTCIFVKVIIYIILARNTLFRLSQALCSAGRYLAMSQGMEKYRGVSAEELRAQHSAYAGKSKGVASPGSSNDVAASAIKDTPPTQSLWRVEGSCAASNSSADTLFLVRYASPSQKMLPPNPSPASSSSVEDLAAEGAHLWLTQDELAAILPADVYGTLKPSLMPR
jgi:hypothetical protein